MTAPDEPGVWVFNGNGGHFPSAVFSTVENANAWIAKHKLSGLLTWYPLDVGLYDWAADNGYWRPKYNSEKTPEFIQRFSSARTDHRHYENGSENGSSGARPDRDDTQTAD
jgi:hypothetical protein